jgi:uncharacterized protein (UPF0548 family)
MFTFRRPTDDDIRSLLACQQGQPWSYDLPEITKGEPAPRLGWQIDRHRVLLGRGAETYAAACEAIRQWKMFPREMCQVFSPDTGSGVCGGPNHSSREDVAPPTTPDPFALPQRPGDIVAVLYRAQLLGLWMLFPARVVYAVDDAGLANGVCKHPDGADDSNRVSPIGRLTPPARLCYGFAYGTLPDHPERGEERFLVEWNRADDSVWYELLAVSRPGHWLARLGYPYARYEQARFRRLSGQAMQESVRVWGYGGVGV